MPVTWLHISDLHIRAGDSYDRDLVFRALVKSVRRFRERDTRAPDLIFATGDIAFSGKPDEYVVATEFFDQLLAAAGLDRHRLYVVPGNHDVDRTFACQLDRDFSPSSADAYFHPANPKLHLREGQGSFLRWHRRYFDKIRTMPENSTCGPVELVQIRGKRLGILPINTALLCKDHLDHERLLVGRRCLDAAIEELNQQKADLKIALMHHPLHDLSEIERPNIRTSLVEHLDVILKGHEHEGHFAGVDLWSGVTLCCSAGATYQTRERPNTAYYGTFDRDHITIFPIRYEDHPRELWTVDPSVFPWEARYEASFSVPRDTKFRSFRIPLQDSKYQIPPRKLADETRPSIARDSQRKSGHPVRFMQASGEDRPAKRSSPKRTKNQTKTKRRKN